MRDRSQLAGNSQSLCSGEPESTMGARNSPGEPGETGNTRASQAVCKRLRMLRGATATLKAPEKATSERSQESPRKLKDTGEKNLQGDPK